MAVLIKVNLISARALKKKAGGDVNGKNLCCFVAVKHVTVIYTSLREIKGTESISFHACSCAVVRCFICLKSTHSSYCERV